MLFTWDTTNLCIVFKGWRITGTGSLIASLIAIVLLTAGYEAVREASRRYEAHAARLGERRGAGEFYTSHSWQDQADKARKEWGRLHMSLREETLAILDGSFV